MPKKVTLLTGGDTVYVFDPDDTERIHMQYMVLVASNLDVEQMSVNATAWQQADGLADELGLTIVDTRTDRQED